MNSQVKNNVIVILSSNGICAVPEKRGLNFDNNALQQQQQKHHQQLKQQQELRLQQQRRPQQVHQQQTQVHQQHIPKPAEVSMGLNLDQYIPQARPVLQPEPDHTTLDEDTALKILSKGELSYLLLTNHCFYVHR